MRTTNVIEKALTSVINFVIVFIISFPFFKYLSFLNWKISIIIIFFLYNLFFLIFNENRCLGMMAVGTIWDKKVSFPKELLFIFIYTLSFSTLFFWIWFPFDIFLINILFLQLPTILMTGTTFHGYLSGNKCSMIESKT